MQSILRRTALAAWLATTCCAGLGCAPEARPAQDLVVTSDPAHGELAVIEYPNGDRVLFLGEPGGDISVAAVFDTARGSPLRDVDVARLAPSDVFAHLAGRPAPSALLDAERAADMASEPEALARLRAHPAAGGEYGQAAQALTEGEFLELCRGSEYCATNLFREHAEFSDGRVRKVRVIASAVHNGIEVEIVRDGERVYLTQLATMQSIDVTRRTVGVIRRFWNVHVRFPGGGPAVYHLSVDFDRR